MRKSFAAAAVLLSSAAWVHAQTGPDLLLKPLLSENEVWESGGDAMIFNSGSATGGADYDMDVFSYQGRFREQRERLIPRIGWDFNFYHLNSDIKLLDQNYTDVSLAAGVELGTYYDWRAALTVGIGYAGNSPFGEGDAWYGKATLLMGHKLDDKTQLGMVIDYDGNRSIWPDIPLPGFAYIHQYDPTLSYTLGVPVTSVTWKPNESFSADLTWIIVDTFNVTAQYHMTSQWSAFASFERKQQAFHADNLHGVDRLLFEQHRAELGIRWKPLESTSFEIAGGYGFGGQWSTGWDQRRSDKLADISDEPYFRVGFERRF